jgi:peptidoglycan hydrolase-like protein with peptidoglycan-binding domain
MNKILKTFLVFLIFLFPIIVKAECFFDFNNLSISNQTNTDKANIVRLQSILFVNNLYTGPITGYYGKMTEKAINAFKADNGLTANGIVDAKTINLLCDNYSDCPFKSLLEKNDEYPKQEIKFIQYFLRLIPNIYPEKLVTGFYGSKTENAVKRLQSFLAINSNGKIDNNTRQEFCDFFEKVDSATLNTKSETTSSIFQSLCLAFPKTAKTGTTVTFISQILGGTGPYKYS